MPATKPYAYACPWCVRKGWIGSKAEVQKHMDSHPHDKDPKDVAIPLKSDPFDANNLRKLKFVDTYKIGSICKNAQRSAFVLPDGEVIVSGFGHHEGMMKEAMEMSGLSITHPTADVDEYMAKSGVVQVHLFGNKVTISGFETTTSQVSSLKDILLYAEIDDPDKVDCILPDVEARDLCG